MKKEEKRWKRCFRKDEGSKTNERRNRKVLLRAGMTLKRTTKMKGKENSE